ncbi:MAG: hypothetical protein ACR2GF_03800 [Acidimicrobiales bacterium]
MSPSKSFWSGIPVLAKAIGGIVTGLVGVGSLLLALGVIGNSNANKNNSPSATTVPSSNTSGNSGGSGGGVTATTSAKASFTVDPRSVSLKALDATTVVTVTNQGTGPLTVKAPELDGPQKDQFKVDAKLCVAHAVAPDGSCTLSITYSGILEAKATMTVTAENASPVTVSLTGTLA